MSLPSQKPGPGRLVTIESVSAFTGVKSAASAGVGVSPHGPLSAAVVVVVEPLLSGLSLLPHAAALRPRATVNPMTANLRIRRTSRGECRER